MKKTTTILLLLLMQITVMRAQTGVDVQLLYSPRHAFHSQYESRNFFISTVEFFSNDKHGSTYGFVDFNYDQTRGNVGMAYMEIGHDFKMGKCPIMAHVEYNGGIVRGGENNTLGFSIPNAYLLGMSYNHTFGCLNYGTYLVYKYNAFTKVSNDVQWTNTWDMTVLKGKLTIDGFIDMWTENKDQVTGKGGKKIILLTQPQFWYNTCKHLALGSEIEISNNFYAKYGNKMYVNPTIAAKWSF